MIDKIDNMISDNNFKMIMTSKDLYINNYLKVLTIENDLIRIKTLHKSISIKGNNLYLKRILHSELLIVGNITNIEVYDE